MALISLEDWEAEQMRDPEFAIVLAELESAYQVARLRILRSLTQEQRTDPTAFGAEDVKTDAP